MSSSAPPTNSYLIRYCTGSLDLPIINTVNEGLTSLMLIALVTGFTGNDVWFQPSVIPGLTWSYVAQIFFGAMLVGSMLGQWVNQLVCLY